MVFVAAKAKLAPLACVVLLARLVLLAPSGFVARLALPVPSVPWARTVSRVTPVPRVSRVIPVRLDPRAPRAQPVSLVRMARTVKWDPRVCVEIVAHRVCVAWLGPLVPKALRARRALRVAPAPAGSKGFKAPRVIPVRVGPSVLVVVVPPVLRDLKASKGPRESVASPVRARAALLAPWAPRVNVARWASKVPRVILVHLAAKVSLVAMVSRATRVLPVLWAALVFVAPRATVVCRAPRATLDSKVPRATRVMLASVGLLGLPV